MTPAPSGTLTLVRPVPVPWLAKLDALSDTAASTRWVEARKSFRPPLCSFGRTRVLSHENLQPSTTGRVCALVKPCSFVGVILRCCCYILGNLAPGISHDLLEASLLQRQSFASHDPTHPSKRAAEQRYSDLAPSGVCRLFMTLQPYVSVCCVDRRKN